MSNYSVTDLPNACLMMSNGAFFFGYHIGSKNDSVIGEACFSTAMTGYQEAITDPSYAEQILFFTCPYIGNVGVNSDDQEKDFISVKGIVLRDFVYSGSNYRLNNNLDEWLSKNKVMGIFGLDVRVITKYLASKDCNVTCIIDYCPNNFYHKSSGNIFFEKSSSEEIFYLKKLYKKLCNQKMQSNTDLAKNVVCSNSFNWNYNYWNADSFPIRVKNNLNVAVIDFGVKFNILRSLYSLGCNVKVFPYNVDVNEIISYKPNGILLSNGPGDPIKTFPDCKELLMFILNRNIPLFGICFGHQLLALALGAKTHKMNHGHRSITHPVLVMNKRVCITTQNHGFVVQKDTLDLEKIQITHISLIDNSVEGIKSLNYKAFSVQYHPECSPGPNDSLYLFDNFIKMMQDNVTY